MDDKIGFGIRIKEMREYRKLTIEEAAEQCDCSVSTWKQYERGERLSKCPKVKKYLSCVTSQARIYFCALNWRACKRTLKK